jgi:type IV secretion system protein VirD4
MSLQLILGRSCGGTPKGIGFVGRRAMAGGDLISYAGDGHLMTFAPTGCGKTSGPVICNALTHPGQLIVIDIKGEIHEKTADARRAMGQQVHVLDMSDRALPGSLNPLDLLTISGSDYAAMARGFAAEFLQRSDNERDPFWNDWAESMIAGGLAWLMADNPPEKRTLGALFDLYSKDDVDYNLAVMIDEKKVKDRAAYAAFAS